MAIRWTQWLANVSSAGIRNTTNALKPLPLESRRRTPLPKATANILAWIIAKRPYKIATISSTPPLCMQSQDSIPNRRGNRLLWLTWFSSLAKWRGSSSYCINCKISNSIVRLTLCIIIWSFWAIFTRCCIETLQSSTSPRFGMPYKGIYSIRQTTICVTLECRKYKTSSMELEPS